LAAEEAGVVTAPGGFGGEPALPSGGEADPVGEAIGEPELLIVGTGVAGGLAGTMGLDAAVGVTVGVNIGANEGAGEIDASGPGCPGDGEGAAV
jgi:hypothetical protein